MDLDLELLWFLLKRCLKRSLHHESYPPQRTGHGSPSFYMLSCVSYVISFEYSTNIIIINCISNRYNFTLQILFKELDYHQGSYAGRVVNL